MNSPGPKNLDKKPKKLSVNSEPLSKPPPAFCGCVSSPNASSGMEPVFSLLLLGAHMSDALPSAEGQAEPDPAQGAYRERSWMPRDHRSTITSFSPYTMWLFVPYDMIIFVYV